MSEANVAIARLAYQAIARGDGRGLWKMLDAAVTSHSSDEVANPARHGRRDVLKFMRRSIRDGSAGELVDVIDVDEQVIVVLRPRMSEGVQPAMRANLTTFEDGRVIRMVAYDSPAAALSAARTSTASPASPVIRSHLQMPACDRSSVDVELALRPGSSA